MFAYSTSLPEYLDYVASAMNRQDILDDPRMCHLLENPVLKDNMEMALHFRDAKYGGYDEKKEFLEYFFCNGPELDSDTILYYREKCYLDPIYLQIAEIEFGNFEIIDQLRAEKYGKKSEEGNCFTQPCNYLGPFGVSIGMMGDSNNFLTLSNIFAKQAKPKTDENKDDSESSEVGAGKKNENGEDTVWGHIRQHVTQKIIPNIRTGIQSLYNNMQGDMQKFVNRCEKTGITKHISLGDPVAIDRSESISAASKINIYNNMGDCARLWQHMRQFNAYDPEKNKREPIPDDAVVANKSPQGTSIDNANPTTSIDKISTPSLRAMAASGDEIAKVKVELREGVSMTLEAIQEEKQKDMLTFAQNKSEETTMAIANSSGAGLSNPLSDIAFIGNTNDFPETQAEAKQVQPIETSTAATITKEQKEKVQAYIVNARPANKPFRETVRNIAKVESQKSTERVVKNKS